MSKRKLCVPLRSNENKLIATIATYFEKEYFTLVERMLAETGVSRLLCSAFVKSPDMTAEKRK